MNPEVTIAALAALVLGLFVGFGLGWHSEWKAARQLLMQVVGSEGIFNNHERLCYECAFCGATSEYREVGPLRHLPGCLIVRIRAFLGETRR